MRNVPDFPIPGIQFKDVSTLFKEPACLHEMSNEITRIYRDKGITKVVGIESRGFVMGAIVAERLGAGFVMCRKPGKLPADTRRQEYGKEYGKDAIEIHTDALNTDDVVLIQDDLLATGVEHPEETGPYGARGSAKAAIDLVRSFGVKKIYCSFIIDLRIEGLKGREFIGDSAEVSSLLTIEE